jgi:hypothetical protein
MVTEPDGPLELAAGDGEAVPGLGEGEAAGLHAAATTTTTTAAMLRVLSLGIMRDPPLPRDCALGR